MDRSSSGARLPFDRGGVVQMELVELLDGEPDSVVCSVGELEHLGDVAARCEQTGKTIH